MVKLPPLSILICRMAFKQSCDVTFRFVLSCPVSSFSTLSSALIVFFATYQSQLSREISSLIHYINLDQNILWALSYRRIYNLRQVPLEGRQAVFPVKGNEDGILVVPNPTSRQPLPWMDSFEHVPNSRVLQKCHIATPLDK